MPELPEVETVRAHLGERIAGARIEEMAFRRDDLRYPMPIAALKDLRGATIRSVARRAKYLLLQMDAEAGPPNALIHLGMSGRLFVEAAEPQDFAKHEHWRWTLLRHGQPLWLRYVDPRRFGALDVVPRDGRHRLLDGLGPEPLGAHFTAAWLEGQLRGKRIAVKVAIMDAAAVVGVGNIYASEACFRASLHPLRPAAGVTHAECRMLVAAIRSVLSDAIAAGGSTLKDFVGGNGAPGYFQQQLDVYGRQGEPCLRCQRAGNVSAVERTVAGQRATFFCPACQT